MGKKKKALKAGRKAKEKRQKFAKELAKEPDALIRMAKATEPLAAMFAVVDDVFTEEDAFQMDKMKAGFGRIYRQWKSSREMIDPDFKSGRY